jgi:hypothetical protein
MISVPRGLALGVLFIGTFSICAQNALNDTRSTLEKWVEARQLISKARTDWQGDKELLEQTKQLFQRELISVQEQMAKLGTNNAQVEKERAEAETLKRSSNESLEKARQFASEIDSQLKKLVPQLPQPLQEILKPSLNRLPTDPNTRMTAAERMQVIVGMLNELDKFNSAVSIFSEKRKDQRGQEIAVETVYIGLGAAYFVNSSGDFAGKGMPGPTGWEWSTEPQLASVVREVIQIYRNERPARFVALPAVIR